MWSQTNSVRYLKDMIIAMGNLYVNWMNLVFRCTEYNSNSR